ncbi:MAG: NADH dehydrogenase (quinone) subunit D [Nitrospinota bacterium]
MTLSMGPQHPSTHGVLRLILELNGETVLGAKADIGYLHTGMEKTMEAKTYTQALTVTDRMDYLAPLSNNLAYVLPVEKLLGLEIPPRAQYARVILAELTRIASHLIWLATHALDLGAMTVFLYCFREREQVVRIFERVSGVRMMTSYFRIGGLARPLYPEFEEEVWAFLNAFPDRIDEYETLLTDNPIFKRRTVGVGAFTAEQAIDLGLSGPNLRACGVALDMRKAQPYSSYDHFDFEIPTQQNGDVYDRYRVRIAEMRESVKIIRQALDRLPDGPVLADAPKIVPPPKERLAYDMEALIHHFLIFTHGFNVPKGEAYVPIEGPRGEVGFYIVSDGGPKPYKAKLRPPSFVSVQALEKVVVGRIVADVVAIIASLDFILGEVDR